MMSGRTTDPEEPMGVSGDLATIDLADLLQNIEAHARTGTLVLKAEDGDSRLFFKGGRVALMTRSDRPSFAEALVMSGQLSQRKLDAARGKLKVSKRCRAELLVGSRMFAFEALKELAENRLREEVADLIADARGEFAFEETTTPGAGFDPDEASLQLALPVAPLVLEATRRIDHWVEIRKFVPADAMHFRAREGARVRGEAEDQELATELLKALDGSRSALEVVGMFPDRRFLAYKLLADLVRDRAARPVTGDDLLKLAVGAAAADEPRARMLVRRGLDSEPHHEGLLAAEAKFAERLDDASGAAAAHKLLAHLHAEAGRTEEAVSALEQAKRLTPNDPTLWERTLQLALAQGRREDGLRDGMQLVALYRGPGLHARAKAVLERLLRVEPDAIDLHLEFARTAVDCGAAAEGIKHLARRGKALVGAGNYVAARTIYAEILAIDPNHNEATISIEMIDKEEFAHRRERRRRVLFATGLGTTAAAFGTALVLEVSARIACIEARSLLSRERVIEQGHYQDAIAVWQRVRSDHPWTPTAWFDLPRQIADLEERAAEATTLMLPAPIGR
jgi:tetratricopeptide (TPR) repeat protein